MPSRTGSQNGEAREGERERARDDVSSPLISRFPVLDFVRGETNDGLVVARCGEDEGGGGVRWRKKSRALLPAHERTKDRGVRGRVQIVFGGQG